MAPPYCPRRGDIVWLTFDPQAGRRPALVLSPEPYNRKVGLALFWRSNPRFFPSPFGICPYGLG